MTDMDNIKRNEAGQFLTTDKPIATITQIADKYFVLKMGDKEIGSSSRSRAERYARNNGFKIVKSNGSN